MKPTWLYILLSGVKLVHVAIPTVFTIMKFKIKSGFSAVPGTQCLHIYLLSFLLRSVRTGHVIDC